MVFLKVAIAMSVILAVVGILIIFLTSWGYGLLGGISYCKTPDGDEGDCVPLHFCKSKLLQGNRSRKENALPGYGSLQIISCGNEGNRVCCPRMNVRAASKKPKNPINLLLLESCGKFGNTNSNFPWMARLGYQIENGFDFRCGGSLINDKYVLTAAHCITPNLTSRTPKVIGLGEYNTSSLTDCDKESLCASVVQDIEVESYIRHEDYEGEDCNNDIALIRLEAKVKITERVRPICLPIHPFHEIPRSVIVTGWGLTEQGKPSEVHLQGKLDFVARERCKKIIGTGTLTDIQICLKASIPREESKMFSRVTSYGATCIGDRGGPIQALQDFGTDVRFVQYGVVSQGGSCNNKSVTGIHTRLDRYLDWITNNII